MTATSSRRPSGWPSSASPALDLLDLASLEQTTAALADLAAAVLESAVRLAGGGEGGEDGLAVVGMGKLGGRELNYASDVDVMFVGGDARRAREVMELARRCFRVDANLRPEGRDGPLTRSLDSYAAYWDRWAQPWEFQALIKAVPVAGDREVGTRGRPRRPQRCGNGASPPTTCGRSARSSRAPRPR